MDDDIARAVKARVNLALCSPEFLSRLDGMIIAALGRHGAEKVVAPAIEWAPNERRRMINGVLVYRSYADYVEGDA